MTGRTHTSSPLQRAATLIQQADGMVIAAGAGMGVDSGLPDFRGDHGFWRSYPALGHLGLSFMEMATPYMFHADPALAWGFYGHRLAMYRSTQPHEGFELLQRWACGMDQGAFIYTSNVDGQFQKAGFAPDAVHECHGSLHWLQCLLPCGPQTWPATHVQPRIDETACHWLGPLPTCPQCGGIARPSVLMFNDMGWLQDRYDRQRDKLDEWLGRVKRPVVIEIGAGDRIATVRRFSERMVRRDGGRLIRINLRESRVYRPDDVGLAQSALVALRDMDALLRGD
jgi:NAD-dependent SIR2 family protein deacetylase